MGWIWQATEAPRRLMTAMSAGVLIASAALSVHDGGGLYLISAAMAQGAGNGPAGGPSAGGPGGAGTPGGSGSGGTSSGNAGPRGTGAGGSTAGSGTATGGSGSSFGAGPVNQNRYGGPSGGAPPAPTTNIITNTILQNVGGGAGGEGYAFLDRCADYRGGKLSPQERIIGRNLDLVHAAQRYIAPNVNPDTFRSATYLLASYQEEIDNGKTDPLVAGSYLGLAATIPVTEEMVGRVNSILCVTTRAETARQIAESAETQRRATNSE